MQKKIGHICQRTQITVNFFLISHFIVVKGSNIFTDVYLVSFTNPTWQHICSHLLCRTRVTSIVNWESKIFGFQSIPHWDQLHILTDGNKVNANELYKNTTIKIHRSENPLPPASNNNFWPITTQIVVNFTRISKILITMVTGVESVAIYTDAVELGILIKPYLT